MSTVPRTRSPSPLRGGGSRSTMLTRLQWILPLMVLALAVGLGLWLLSAERRGRRGELQAEARAQLDAATTQVANEALRALAELEEDTADLVLDAAGEILLPPAPRGLFQLSQQLSADEHQLLRLSDSLAQKGRLDAAIADTLGLADDPVQSARVRLLARLRAAGFAARMGREDRARELRREALTALFGERRREAGRRAEDGSSSGQQIPPAAPGSTSIPLPADWRFDREAFAARMSLVQKDPLFAEDLLALVGSTDEALAIALSPSQERVRAQQRRIELRRSFRALIRARPAIVVGPAEAGRAWIDDSRLWLVRAEAGGERLFVLTSPMSQPSSTLRMGLQLENDPLAPSAGRATGAASSLPFQAERRIGLPFPEARASLTLDEATFARELDDRSLRVVLLFAPASLLVAGALALALRAFARQAAESRARAELVARVGHELRTPLAALRLSVETLASGRADRPEEIREFAQLAVEEAERLAGRVTHALDLGRLVSHGDGPLEDLDLRALCADAIETARPLAGAKEAALDANLPVGAVTIRGDATALRAALLCLIDNALRHGQDLTQVALSLLLTDTQATVSVADDGAGWPVEDPRSLLGRFVRGAHSRVTGAGLGLALVAEVADRHGAELTLGVSTGDGALVTLSFSRLPPGP